MRALLVILVSLAPTLAVAQGAPFDLPRLDFPPPEAPVTQSCLDPAGAPRCVPQGQ
ncbi:hypothetical protein [Gemmobacter caeruleus]|uniref:hypothetical protein n=1 Tax=Gemmobacter caeruleus TaxID=2595004 RepID=UPI0013969FD6|nr:hypothetical protein [Gemmobacter caeruleus]